MGLRKDNRLSRSCPKCRDEKACALWLESSLYRGSLPRQRVSTLSLQILVFYNSPRLTSLLTPT